MIKSIFTNEYPPISSIQHEINKTRNVLTEMLVDKFKSEQNTNTYNYAENALDSYCYVPNMYRIWVGRYIRYIDITEPHHAILKQGGFLISDNGYTVTLRNDTKLFRVSKRGKLFFMIMMNSDAERIQMNKLHDLIC